MQGRQDVPSLRSNSSNENDALSSSGESLISQSSAPLQANLETTSINDLLMASNIHRLLPSSQLPPGGSLSFAVPSASSAMPLPPIETVPQFLDRLNLAVYCDRFVAEGFDSMISVFEMTEEDFTAMDVKRGHRRILQLEFARLRGFYHNDFELTAPVDPDLAGYATNLPLHFARNSPEDDAFSAISASVSQRFPLSASAGSPSAARPARSGSAAVTQAPEPTGKRRYRRHPKPDPAAPDKPPSAYVAFSANVREENKGKTFTELAKIVGDRWKNLDEATRASYEETANAAKEEWTAKMTEYKRTDSYKKYQKYLLDFRERHPKQPAGDKQPTVVERASAERQTPTTERPSCELPPVSPVYTEHSDKRDRSVSPPSLATQGSKRLRTASLPGGPSDQFSGAFGGTTLWNERAFQPQAGPSGRGEDFLPPRYIGEPLGLSARSTGTVQTNPSASYDRYQGGNVADHQSPTVSTSYDRSTLARDE